jgi:hypothetical protein
MKKIALGTLALGLAVGLAVHGQQAAPQQGASPAGRPAPPPAAPAPRWPDGRISFSGGPKDVGNWDGPADASMFFEMTNGKEVRPRSSLPTNPSLKDVPFKPEFKELYLKRHAALQADDPHTRCKPSGGPRMFHTPYGIEIVDSPETQEVFVLAVGAPHSWRVIYMDGREHPKDLKPSWYGHSVGKWEGDTLVVDSLGYNARAWLTREGVPYTPQLHLTERISRPNHNQLRYEATVDDPGAYTAKWGGGWNLRWGEGNEPFDYLCQENNRDPGRMTGPKDKQ